MIKTSRRVFLGTALGASALTMVSGCESKPKVAVTTLHDTAPDGPELKAGLIGCGGRGTGAAVNFLKAGPNLTITAMGDVFKDRIDSSREKIKQEMGTNVPESRCFVGFDAFRKVIESGVDIVLLATPPHFRAEHFAAAVQAGKHVFMEKPVAVDPVGVRSVIETAGQAKTQDLCVVTGTQRHHQKQYVETFRRIADGMIGDIVAARCYWNQNKLWHNERKEGWSDMEWMIRDWVNWTWLSGDHIVEQHVHNIDVINWFTGMHPVKAVGFGGRHRRPTGDQYDFFSIDFSFENGMHCHSMCRQIDGCANNVSEYVVGTKGSSNCSDTIYRPDGTIAWQFSKEELKQQTNPYDQEHIDLVTAIRTGETINEAERTAMSCMDAIMGRQSAYTGAELTRQEMTDSELRLGPTEYVMGNIGIDVTIPVPGTAPGA